VTFGLTRGELILIAFIFALVYGAGFLPKLAARLSRASGKTRGKDGAPRSDE
jgi:Sec-independent protein translocase protein TatA